MLVTDHDLLNVILVPFLEACGPKTNGKLEVLKNNDYYFLLSIVLSMDDIYYW